MMLAQLGFCEFAYFAPKLFEFLGFHISYLDVPLLQAASQIFQHISVFIQVEDGGK
jgi:hypothetical protein